MIVITTYHGRIGDGRFITRRKYLEETIRSIDQLNINSLFHLIIDDGSTDGIYEYLKIKYRESSNRRIIRREKPDVELLTSTNAKNFAINLCLNSREVEGVDISQQNCITFVDSDDVAIDLKDREQYMEENCIGFLYTDALLFFSDSLQAFFWKGLDPKKAYFRFWIYGCMPYPTMTWSLSFLRDLVVWIEEKYRIVGPFDPNIGCGEDVDIALSSFEIASNKKYKIGYLQSITMGYRLHELSLASIRNQTIRTREENAVLTRHFGRVGKSLLHVGRFFIRPECYFPSLMPLKNKFRAQTNKKHYLGGH